MAEIKTLVLASASKIRQALLANAGLTFDVSPADVDEPFLRQAFLDDNPSAPPGDVADLLARAKSGAVSDARHGDVVIGADQVLVCNGRIFDKPGDMEEAADRLLMFSGKTHELHAAVTIAHDGVVEWTYTDVAYLTMRKLEPEYIGRYLAAAGRSVLSSVGGYALERQGIHLFEAIEGDYFTILGLPMLPLLAELRETYGIGLGQR